MKTVSLYPVVEVKGLDFSKEKNVFVPNQSLTLKQIIQRFIRNEPLHVGQKGFYAEGFGDLEKMSVSDITVQLERADTLKNLISDARTRMKNKDDAEKQAAIEKAAAEMLAKQQSTTNASAVSARHQTESSQSSQ